mmetsp:Transcript_553/g.1580  ORF Transcript_553/g.1580 Transcript_553/m.1580 type:complete len:177 (+) Transcript_553:1302-1832(+)
MVAAKDAAMTLTVRPYTTADLPAISTLCWAYRDLLTVRNAEFSELVDLYYAKPDYSALIADLPRIHARPKGEIFVADQASAVVGCAMYYEIAPGTCEIKRVFVDEAARGSGAGRALMQAGIDGATRDGYRRMVLDTVHTLPEAIALYEAMGFAPCAPFYEPDPRFITRLRFFDIAL